MSITLFTKCLEMFAHVFSSFTPCMWMFAGACICGCVYIIRSIVGLR